MSDIDPSHDDAPAGTVAETSPSAMPPTPSAGEPRPFAGAVPHRTGEKPRRTIAVSGAKGGSGKSVAACNLAIYLSTLGRTTLLVDADRTGAHLHTLLGVPPQLPTQRLTAPRAEPPSIVTTQVPGLFFLHGCVDEGRGEGPSLTRATLFSLLHEVDCDYLVLDLGAGLESDLLDVYLEADLALYVTLPEPPAVEGTYRFVRALFLRSLVRAAHDDEAQASLRALAHELGGLPVPRELVEALESDMHPLAVEARALLLAEELHFVVNQSRVRTDLELGESMRSAAWQRLGSSLHYLGYIDHDDNVWACVRERKPLLVKSPGTKASKSFEKLARRLLSLGAHRGATAPKLRTTPRGSHHDLLEIDRGATDEEIRRAYRRMREVYAEEALCCYGLYTPDELRAVRTHLDEAFDVLLDPARRRPYELSVFPDIEADLLEELPPAARARDLPPAPAIAPETEFDGSLLRLVRESQGLDLKQISRRTKINLAYLEAVEGDDFSALPALVYVRGFVAEMAKCLRLDPVQVAHTYVRRVKQRVGESA